MRSYALVLPMVLLHLLLGALPNLIAQRIPNSYIAHKTTDFIDIDGRDDEASWQKAMYSTPFIDIEGEKVPKYRTRMKMLWDDGYLYILAKLEEPHIWGNLKQRDTVVFYNNDFEVFIDPDGDTHNYYELELNALNTVWDLFLTKPYRNGATVLDSWDIQGLKSAISIEGTLNDPSDIDDHWMVELAIPWAVLVEASKSNDPPQNEFWRINFSRVNWQFDLNGGHYSRKKDEKGKYLPEYNWVWSPQGVINMHEPEHWGYVYFSDQEVGADVKFTIPKDEHIKWSLYREYRKKFANAENRPSKNIDVSGKTIELFTDEHQSGWNIWAISPFSGRKLTIDHDGKFYAKEE
ncbi:carbohydrate-binding family 9-like protein [Allomuricauda sp. SCSIO 65647]|uniref:carbohydrate-binding family 9-like protein n=1 Tax=Allomuricauda sp. SCSIO 65647 TaxID=2908843 RepID=UPI001F45144C|nr:carbohydrate-binding family 9-like protein [Muricauda sp. SCSIO 65647]UJH66351.1 carbohydrate-binding family 9-like protein [Muricauda sp. SCSIO 65647]